MSQLNRKALKALILKEFKMLEMQPMHSMGSPMGMSSHGESRHSGHDHGVEEDFLGLPDHHGHSGKGSVSREDCCIAVKCLIECCSCPVTKKMLIECCDDLMAGAYDK